jgi:hypothetical protein
MGAFLVMRGLEAGAAGAVRAVKAVMFLLSIIYLTL